MRKSIILILAGLTLMSCSEAVGYGTATFGYDFGNSMTKTSTDDIQDAVASITSGITDAEFSFYVNKVSYSKAKAGEEVTLPVGQVRALLTYRPSSGQSIGKDVSLYTAPTFVADSTLDFHSYTGNVVVKARYNCALVVCDRNVVGSLSSGTTSLETADLGKYEGFFIYSNAADANFDITVTPKENTDYTERTLNIAWANLEKGKFYFLSPTGLTEGTTTFGLSLGEFVAGGEL